MPTRTALSSDVPPAADEVRPSGGRSPAWAGKILDRSAAACRRRSPLLGPVREPWLPPPTPAWLAPGAGDTIVASVIGVCHISLIAMADMWLCLSGGLLSTL